MAYGRRARPGLMQDILISVTPASCEYDILDLPQHAKSPNPDSPPPTALHTHIFGLESPITSTPLSRSGQSVNQPVCELEVRLYPPEYTALHHHGQVILFASFLEPSPTTPGSNASSMCYTRLSGIYWCGKNKLKTRDEKHLEARRIT